MAFANGNGGASLFITEKDLLRQVASNLTKETLVSKKAKQADDDIVAVEVKLEEKAAADSKRLMGENVARAVKVWYAFAKFVKNQVTVSGRLVDTDLIGLFLKDQATGDIIYMPSRDYLEAGKFKLQRGRGAPMNETLLTGGVDLLDSYASLYNAKLQVSATPPARLTSLPVGHTQGRACHCVLRLAVPRHKRDKGPS